MARVLLYNFRNEARRKKLKALLFRLALPSREVEPEEQGYPLGTLLGASDAAHGEPAAPETTPGEPAAPETTPGEPADPGAAPGEEEAEPFHEEMLVMHGLAPRQFHGLVDGLRQQGVLVPLKAVVTPHNIQWTSARLHRELRLEHAAMSGKNAAPVHAEADMPKKENEGGEPHVDSI